MQQSDTRDSVDGEVLFVVVDLDEVLKSAILELRGATQSHGGRVFPGNSPMRPHISVAAYVPGAIDGLSERLNAIASMTPPFLVHLSALGFFTGTNTIFALPASSPALNDLHEAILRILPERAARGDEFMPGRWVPHVTVTTRVTDGQFGPACSAVARTFRPVSGNATGLTTAVVRYDSEGGQTVSLLGRHSFSRHRG